MRIKYRLHYTEINMGPSKMSSLVNDIDLRFGESENEKKTFFFDMFVVSVVGVCPPFAHFFFAHDSKLLLVITQELDLKLIVPRSR